MKYSTGREAQVKKLWKLVEDCGNKTVQCCNQAPKIKEKKPTDIIK